MERIAVVSGLRTPFCKMGTTFANMPAQELGRIVTRELLERTGFDASLISEVIFGCVGQPMEAANVARVIALLSGIPDHVPAYTVHRNCASGIEAVVQASMKIHCGQGDIYLVGGTESMSRIPFLVSDRLQSIYSDLSKSKSMMSKLKVLQRFRLKDLTPKVGLMLGLADPVCGLTMGHTAEVLADEFGISRKEQDEFSCESHVRSVKAKGFLKEEMMSVVSGKNFSSVAEHDNGVRENQTMEALQKLKPIFDRQIGTVTAGNASQITDGAVALLMMSESKAKELGLEPLGFIKNFRFAGVEPHRMGVGPAHAIPQVLQQAGLLLKDMQAIEINEAFSVQVLACLRSLESEAFYKDHGYTGFMGDIDRNILNVNGGAIALGHPVGATGARLILTMLKHMQRQNLNLGLVSLCVGGGQGAAVILER